MIDIKQIKEKINPLDVFSEDLGQISIEDVKRKRKFLSPFSGEKTPSFNLKYGNNGEIRFNDFSTGKHGDVFKYIMERKNMTLPESLKYLNDKFNLGLNGQKSEFKNDRWKAIYYEEMTSEAKRYWRTFGITAKTLKDMFVRQIKVLTYTSSEKKQSKYNFENEKTLAFEFIKNGRRKCYIPKQSGKEFKGIIQTCKTGDLFGNKANVKGKDEFGILCEGEKDTLVMLSMGFTAYCLHSANVDLSKEHYRHLKTIANDWIIIYDNDRAGRVGAKKISNKWNLPIYYLYNDLKEGEDIADWAKRLRTQGDKTKDKESGFEKWALSWSKMLKGSILEQIQIHKISRRLNIWEANSQYYKWVRKSKAALEEELETNIQNGQGDKKINKSKKVFITNFIIENEVFIEGEQESQRIVKLKSNIEETDFFAISTDSFISPKAFQTFAESKGNFYFSGMPIDLIALKQYTFSTAKKAVQVNQIGYDSRHNCFVLSNQIILNDGQLVKPNKYGIAHGLYIPAADQSNRFNPDFGVDKKYIFQQNLELKTWDYFKGLSELFYPTAAIIGIAHIIATLHYDIITKEHLKLPLLNIWGQKGSGKNSFVELLLCLFGKDENLTHLGNSTANKISRVMSQTANIPQWFDEFKTGMRNYLNIVEVLKGFYDRTGRGRATTSNDTRTKQDKILTSAIITGQDSIKDEALLSRLVTLQFPVIQEDKEKTKLYFSWQNKFRLGLGHLLAEILTYRPTVEKNLKSKVEELKLIIGNEMIERGQKVTARLIDNYAILLAPLVICLESGMPLFGKTESVKNEIRDLLIMVYENIESQAKKEEEKDEVTGFWMDFFSMAERQLIRQGWDYVIVKNEIRFTAFVLAEYEKFNISNMGNFLSKSDLISYMKQKEYYKDYGKTDKHGKLYNRAKEKHSTDVRCYKCDIDQMPKVLQERFEEISDYQPK